MIPAARIKSADAFCFSSLLNDSECALILSSHAISQTSKCKNPQTVKQNLYGTLKSEISAPLITADTMTLRTWEMQKHYKNGNFFMVFLTSSMSYTGACVTNAQVDGHKSTIDG